MQQNLNILRYKSVYFPPWLLKYYVTCMQSHFSVRNDISIPYHSFCFKTFALLMIYSLKNISLTIRCKIKNKWIYDYLLLCAFSNKYSNKSILMLWTLQNNLKITEFVNLSNNQLDEKLYWFHLFSIMHFIYYIKHVK